MSDRWQRIKEISWINLEKLHNCYAVVCGLGALGQPLSEHIVMNGIGNVLLIDKDIIQAHNLPRSPLFRDGDVGKAKVKVASGRLKELNPSCDISSINGDLEYTLGKGIFRELRANNVPVLLFGAVDNRRARILLSEIAHQWGPLPFIDGGIDGESLTGAVKVFMAEKPDSPCYECALSATAYAEAYRRNSCQHNFEEEPGVPTLSTIAASTAAMMASEGIKLLLGLSEFAAVNQELYWDAMHNQLTKSRLVRNSQCLFEHSVISDDLVTVLDSAPDETSLEDLFAAAVNKLGEDARLEWHVPENEQRSNAPSTFSPGFLDSENVADIRNLTLAELGVPTAQIIPAHNGAGEARYFQIGSANELLPISLRTKEARHGQ